VKLLLILGGQRLIKYLDLLSIVTTSGNGYLKLVEYLADISKNLDVDIKNVPGYPDITYLEKSFEYRSLAITS
jgi:hypothetical protein